MRLKWYAKKNKVFSCFISWKLKGKYFYPKKPIWHSSWRRVAVDLLPDFNLFLLFAISIQSVLVNREISDNKSPTLNFPLGLSENVFAIFLVSQKHPHSRKKWNSPTASYFDDINKVGLKESFEVFVCSIQKTSRKLNCVWSKGMTLVKYNVSLAVVKTCAQRRSRSSIVRQ